MAYNRLDGCPSVMYLVVFGECQKIELTYYKKGIMPDEHFDNSK